MARFLGKRSADELNTPLYDNLEPVLDDDVLLKIDKEQRLLVTLLKNFYFEPLTIVTIKKLAKFGSQLNLIEDSRYQYTLGGHGSFNNYFVFETPSHSKEK